MSNLMTVKKVADVAGISGEAVRHYVDIGLLVPYQNPDNQYKMFNKRHLKTLLFIHRARCLGFSLEEIKKIIRQSKKKKTMCPEIANLIQKRLNENKQQLPEMLALQQRLEKAVSHWGDLPDKLPNGICIRQLIEDENMS